MPAERSPELTAPTPPDPSRLGVRGVGKRFGGVAALSDVSLDFAPGSVHAVVGENGAGKSTLMKILAGVQRPGEGSVRVDGRPVDFAGVQDALDAGIALIHQELNLCDNLTVAANISLGREPRRSGALGCLGWVDHAAVRRRAADVLGRVGLNVDPDQSLAGMTIGNRQLVEIAKALSVGARVLIMDEPTSSLTLHETDRLLSIVEDLRRGGVTVIYISHRLNEVIRVADRVSILRDGRHIGELRGDEITHAAMVRGMVGRDIEAIFARTRHPIGDAVLSIEELRTAAHPDVSVSLDVHSGEVVVLAGLVGAGRTELLRTIYGVDPPAGGRIRFGTLADVPSDPAESVAAGMAMVPEDRKSDGVLLEESIRDNIMLPNLYRHRRSLGRADDTAHDRDAADAIERLGIRCAGGDQPVGDLSGGNQQKVAVGKWLAGRPRVLLLDEPTRGVDIGAKEDIYRLIESLAGAGMAVLAVSSDMEEVRGIADRIVVMHQGAVTATLPPTAGEEMILNAAVGRSSSDPDGLSPKVGVESPSSHPAGDTFNRRTP